MGKWSTENLGVVDPREEAKKDANALTPEDENVIRHWMYQMLDPSQTDGKSMGRDAIEEQYGSGFISQIEMMGSTLNSSDKSLKEKLPSEHKASKAIKDQASDSYWFGDQGGWSVPKGLHKGAVNMHNFLIDAGREAAFDVENHFWVLDKLISPLKLLPGKQWEGNPLSDYVEQMKAKSLLKRGGWGWFGRAISSPYDVKKLGLEGRLNDEGNIITARPWLKVAAPYEGQDLGFLGNAAEIVMQEVTFMGPLAWLRLIKASRHATHFINSADGNYGRVFQGKAWLKPQKPGEAIPASERFRKASDTLEGKAGALSEIIGRKVTKKEAKALGKLYEKYGDDDFFKAVRGGIEGEQVTKLMGGNKMAEKALAKVAKTLSPSKAKKLQKIVQSATTPGRLFFKKSQPFQTKPGARGALAVGGAYKETELFASTAVVLGGAWMGQMAGEDMIVVGEVAGGLTGPTIAKKLTIQGADAWNILRYHFGGGSKASKERTLLKAAFGKSKEEIDSLMRPEETQYRNRLIDLATSTPIPGDIGPFRLLTEPFKSENRKQLEIYRDLADQVVSLPADMQASLKIRVKHAEELLGENEEFYATMSQMTGLGIFDSVAQEFSSKASVGKMIQFKIDAQGLKFQDRKIATMKALAKQLKTFHNDPAGMGLPPGNEDWFMYFQDAMIYNLRGMALDMTKNANAKIRVAGQEIMRDTIDLIDNAPAGLTRPDLSNAAIRSDVDRLFKEQPEFMDDIATKTIDGKTNKVVTLNADQLNDMDRLKNEYGVRVMPVSTNVNKILFAPISDELRKMGFKNHGDILSYARMMTKSLYDEDVNDAKKLYSGIAGYSDGALKVNANRFLKTTIDEINKIEKETGNLLSLEVEDIPDFTGDLKQLLTRVRDDSLKTLSKDEKYRLAGAFMEATGREIGDDMTPDDIVKLFDNTLRREIAGDFKNISALDEFAKEAADITLKQDMSVRWMTNARTGMYRSASMNSTRHGTSKPTQGFFEWRIGDKINEGIDESLKTGDAKVYKQLKAAQKNWKDNVWHRWRTGLGLEYTGVDPSKELKLFNKNVTQDFFTGISSDKARAFKRLYIDGKSAEKQKAARNWLYAKMMKNLMDNKKPAEGWEEWTASFSDELPFKTEPMTDSAGNVIENSDSIFRGTAESTQDTLKAYNKDLSMYKGAARENYKVVLAALENIGLDELEKTTGIRYASLNRLAGAADDPKKIRELIMQPSVTGGHSHMVEGILSALEHGVKSKRITAVEAKKARRAMTGMMWEGAQESALRESGSEGIVFDKEKFTNIMSINGASYETYISDYKKPMMKILTADLGTKKAGEVFAKMERMSDIINLVVGQIDRINVKGMPTELQIPSIMSRVYGVFRGVISPRYVMTELLIQDARFRKGEMLRQIATDPDAARIFTDVIFEKGIRNRKIRSEFTQYWLGATQRVGRDFMEYEGEEGQAGSDPIDYSWDYLDEIYFEAIR